MTDNHWEGTTSGAGIKWKIATMEGKEEHCQLHGLLGASKASQAAISYAPSAPMSMRVSRRSSLGSISQAFRSVATYNTPGNSSLVSTIQSLRTQCRMSSYMLAYSAWPTCKIRMRYPKNKRCSIPPTGFLQAGLDAGASSSSDVSDGGGHGIPACVAA